ncbi:hypothetical protein AU189_11470 [Mycolicibacterium acapulense]|nr:hypothetical protein AU189_11470 [Mycolicibacterium acapulense]
MTARWQPIEGWPAYQINMRTGAVRSVDHVDHRGRRWPGRLLRIQHPRPADPDCRRSVARAGGGGPRVTLSDGAKRKTFYPQRYLEARKAHHDQQ